MILSLITDATAEPVTLAEMKEYLRISTATHPDDAMIGGFIKAARVMAETRTHQAFMPQTYKLYLDDFPGGTEAITLPIGPLSTVNTAVTITFVEDSSRQSTTLPSTAYTCDSDDIMGRLYPRYGTYDNEWPTNVADQRKAVGVQFICGYALDASSAPSTKIEPVKTWIKLRVAQMYENRVPVSDGKVVINFNREYVDGLLDSFISPEVH